jgi:hypothetical protein
MIDPGIRDLTTETVTAIAIATEIAATEIKTAMPTGTGIMTGTDDPDEMIATAIGTEVGRGIRTGMGRGPGM